MPELPFLEMLAENLKPRLRGRKITGAVIRQPWALKTFQPPVESVVGQAIQDAVRRGKHLALHLDSGRYLVFHFMRAGRLRLLPPKARSAPTSAKFPLDDGMELRLTEVGRRKRASIYLVERLEEVPAIAGYGPEPLSPEFTEEYFSRTVHESRSRIKTILTDQKRMAGIGNAFSDEILFEAKLSPLARGDSLSPEDLAALYTAVRSVLQRAVIDLRARLAGELPTDEHKELYRVHDRREEPCLVCGTPIEEISYGERNTFYCPECQTGGRVLADRRRSRFLK